MHSKKTYPDTLDAQVEYLKEKLNKNTTKALVKLNKKMGVDLGRSSTKDMWLTACCKKLVTLEGQSLVHKILPKTIIEQLFESFPPPLVKAKFAEEIKNSKSVVTIDDEADTEGSVKEVPNCVRQSSHGSLKQSSLKNDSGFDMKKRTKECNPYENEWVKIIEDLRYEEIDSNPKNPYPCIMHTEESKDVIDCVCGKTTGGRVIECERCGRQQHQKCMSAQQEDKKGFICILCKMKVMDPFILPIYCILKPFEVKTVNTFAKLSMDSAAFDLPEKLYSLLKCSSSVKNDITVQLRCVRIPPPPSGDLICMTGGRSSVNLKGYEHGYPKKGMLHLNNVLHRKFDMPAPPNDEKRRKDEIIEISSYLKMKKNIIDISKVSNHKDSERYFCAIFLCKKFSKKQIIGYVRKKCKEDTSEAMNTLRRRMGKDEIVEGRPLKRRKHAEDDEIVMDRTLNFKFSCPITCTRLRIPVKGYYCEHIECFDLENFIVMNNNFKSFKCPICSKKAVILHVDTINQKMIKVLPPETTQIKIKEDMVAYCNSGVQMDLEKLVEMINNNAPEEEIKANLVVKSTVPFDTETSDNSGSEEEKIPQKEKHVETVNLQNLSSNGTAGKEQLGKKIEDPLEKKNGEAVDEILGSNPPPIRDVFKPPRGRLNFNEPILLD